jgi:hypothetical protein
VLWRYIVNISYQIFRLSWINPFLVFWLYGVNIIYYSSHIRFSNDISISDLAQYDPGDVNDWSLDRSREREREREREGEREMGDENLIAIFGKNNSVYDKYLTWILKCRGFLIGYIYIFLFTSVTRIILNYVNKK